LFLLLLVLGIIYVQLNQAQFLGNAIRIYQNQFPEIYEIFRIHAVNLQINKASLYIVQNPIPNAYTIGITSCSVILTSGLVEQFSLKELNFTLAHELGHYKAGHTKISTLINPLGSTNIFSNIIFGFWQRKTEYSADRCGLILSKDLDSGITALLKLSIGGKLFEDFNLNGYLAQIKKADTTSVKLSELLIDHPLTTNRIRKLIYFWKESFTIKE
jgi:Zn-dependent protease with chaperone function